MDILVIEDDKQICGLLETVLTQEGFKIRFTHNGISGVKAYQEQQPDVIILDWMLPGLDGIEVCQRIRTAPQGNNPYILMLTARDQEVDKIIGLSTGVDDYMVKPFSPRELVARLRALLRRSQRQGANKIPTLQSQHFTMDIESRTAQRGTESLELTTLEFDLLMTFLGQLQRVWTREQLIQRLWGDDFFGDERVVDTHIARLRKKIEYNSTQPKFLQTVTGVGYKFVDGKPHEATP